MSPRPLVVAGPPGDLAVVPPKIESKTESVTLDAVVVAAAGAAAVVAGMFADDAAPVVEAVALEPGALVLRDAAVGVAEVGVWTGACTALGSMLGSGFCVWTVLVTSLKQTPEALSGDVPGYIAIAAMAGAGAGWVLGLGLAAVIITCLRPAVDAVFFFTCCCFSSARALGGGGRSRDAALANAAGGGTATSVGARVTGAVDAALAGAAGGGRLGGRLARAVGACGTATEAVVVAVLPEDGVQMGLPVVS